ncbi:uncharacterized protein LOC115952092 [Quercus lobata]|uniref:uncharacterized protein LOC115952092 n=1 Tax=Quercus lobata TaxID=97700 RepID=UPI001247F228|nr:uncharacterized protein LOC115952092 [Quercus lobata]
MTVWKPEWVASKDLLRRLGCSMIATARMGTEPVEIPNNHCAKMNILLWNCRGALGLDFKRRVLEMMVNHFPSILIITETRVSGDRAARIIEDLPFDGFFTTETIGYAGGLWLLWKRGEVDVVVLSAIEQEIHATVQLLLGDFNEVLCGEDKFGGRRVNLNRAFEFKDFLDDCALQILSGGFFFLKHLLPTCLGIFRTIARFSLSSIDPPTELDKPFRFQTMWLHHPEFPEIVKGSWGLHLNLGLAIKQFTEKAKKWNKDVFGNIFARKRRVLARLYGVQKALSNGPNQFLVQLEKDLMREYAAIMQQEEEYWALKSRPNWAACGDCNTPFFHVSTLVRRHRNKIRSIKNSVGEWITDEEGIKAFILSEYQKLFENGLYDSISPTDLDNFPCCIISEEDKGYLCTPVTDEEIR